MGKLSNYSSFAALAVASATALHVAIKDFNDTAAPQVPHSFADIAERARPGTVFVSLKGSILPDKDGKTTPGAAQAPVL
ncbi:MAG: hypothetical protein LRZ85_03435 [Alphaproteobacteria bacterium]|nr:hypothetical protein [Alphaproteobacteria bacterium]